MTLFIQEEEFQKIKEKPQIIMGTLSFLYYISPLGYLFNREKHDFTLALARAIYERV